MKKNHMMRLASVLLVLVLLSTCAVSTTFAKYATQHNGEDNARAAKWGVEVGVGGALFSRSYAGEAAGNTPVAYDADETGRGITVQANEAVDVVAPGTKNEDGMTFVLKGQPEVDVQVTFTVSGTDVYLAKSQTLTDYTQVTALNGTTPQYDTFAVGNADYRPLKYTLKCGTATLVNAGTLQDVLDKLNSYTQIYEANTDLSKIAGAGADGVYTLTWEWDFGDPTNNAKDTYLGNAAVDNTLVAGNKGSVSASFNIAIKVEQVD